MQEKEEEEEEPKKALWLFATFFAEILDAMLMHKSTYKNKTRF